ncbi:MAG: glucose-6-phosphate dehydrogenase [Myxococcota bacterium]
MAEFIPVEPFDIVIFGATGDLARRMLLPALFHRFRDRQIPASSRVIGVSRTELDADGFRRMAEEACRSAAGDGWQAEDWTAFAALLHYVAMDATDPRADWKPVTEQVVPAPGRPAVFYLATPPSLYVPICRALGAVGLAHSAARVVLEKPIGSNLATAREINDGVGAVFAEDRVYRIDHYLGKETVQNLMVLRFANALFEPVWSRVAVDHVQITVAESLGLEGRADYYDRSGALRDMVQNHLLQLLCLTAMEPPSSIEGDNLRTEKIKVLKALKRITHAEARSKTVRGQYSAGMIGGELVKGYLDELGPGAGSRTETFVAIKAEIDNWRWAGVPFYLRTGKRMPRRHSDIVIQFKPTPHSILGDVGEEPNRLVIRLQPDEGVQLFVQIKEPGPGGLRIKSLPLNLAYAETFTLRYPDAYERLLMDVVRGNLTLFMRREEVEEAWSWVDGLIHAWEESDAGPAPYQAGTEGPLASAMLLDRDGRTWWNPPR